MQSLERLAEREKVRVSLLWARFGVDPDSGPFLTAVASEVVEVIDTDMLAAMTIQGLKPN